MIKRTILTTIFAVLMIGFSVFSMSAEPININTASVQQLTQLNGIGSKKAQAIVEYRKKHGKFKSIDDLQNVSGIGSSIVKKNQKQIRLK